MQNRGFHIGLSMPLTILLYLFYDQQRKTENENKLPIKEIVEDNQSSIAHSKL